MNKGAILSTPSVLLLFEYAGNSEIKTIPTYTNEPILAKLAYLNALISVIKHNGKRMTIAVGKL